MDEEKKKTTIERAIAKAQSAPITTVEKQNFEKRMTRILAALKGHCEKHGIKHPIFDEFPEKEVKDNESNT